MKQNSKIVIALTLIIAAFLASGMAAYRLTPDLLLSLDEDMDLFIRYVIMFILTIIFAFAIKKPFGLYIPSFKPEVRKLNPRLIVTGVILTVAMSIVLSPVINAMPEESMETLYNYMQRGLWPMLTSVLVAPILEEFLFRGVIQHNLIRVTGTILGIICASVIFGIIHIIPQQIIYATGVGLIIGTIYQITKSLQTVIAVHFVNNGLTYLLFIVFGTTSYLESTLLADKTHFVIAYCASAAVLLASGWYAVRFILHAKKTEVKNEEN